MIRILVVAVVVLATTVFADTHHAALRRRLDASGGAIRVHARLLDEAHLRKLRHHHHHQPTEAEIKVAGKEKMEVEAAESAKEMEEEEEAIVMEESSSSSSSSEDSSSDDDDEDSSSSSSEEEAVAAATTEGEEETTVIAAAAVVQDESPIAAILDGSDPNEEYWIAGAGVAGIALVIVGLAIRRKYNPNRKRPTNVETLNLHHPRDPEIEMVMNNTGLSQKVLGARRNSTPSFGTKEDEPIWSIRHSMTSVTGTPEVKQAVKNTRPNKKNSPPASAFQQHKNKF